MRSSGKVGVGADLETAAAFGSSAAVNSEQRAVQRRGSN